jgi:hypothetical protein
VASDDHPLDLGWRSWIFLDPHSLDLERVRHRGDLSYGSAGATTDLRKRFAGTPMETVRGRTPPRRRPSERMVRTALDLPSFMLANLHAAPASGEYKEVLRHNVAAIKNGRKFDVTYIRSNSYVTHDKRCEDQGMPLKIERVRQAS